MSRGRKRSRHSTQTGTNRIPTPQGESLRSIAYTNGQSVKYAYRIHGPQYPVHTYTLNDLPEGSTLT